MATFRSRAPRESGADGAATTPRRSGSAPRRGESSPRLLIANRGEIALRILRGARDEGWEVVAVYSEADRRAPHVALADEAYGIGPAPSSQSYLKIDALLDAARRGRATHVHPGYGFLSENAEFAAACEAAGIGFVGPSADAIRAMGDKVSAREAAKQAGVPLVPGTPGLAHDLDETAAWARELGYPVLLKAAFGGGGKGMRLCRDEKELRSAVELTRGEAGRAFGNDLLYLEKAIERPRHIEIQVLLDHHGDGVHLGERECSIQRRHQKLIEESPSPVIDAATRSRMGEAALALAKGIGYRNAGTVEFLFSPEGEFYFLEMNTRLQVEHPVTEEVTGIDLVRAQLRVALGEPLPWSQADIRHRGWAIECRINAEDPFKGFLPSSGRIVSARLPQGPGIRNDVGFESGGEASVHYDSMLGKLIAWGPEREQARRRLLRALREYRIEGVVTNLPFHRWALAREEFARGELNTGFIDLHWSPHAAGSETDEDLIARLAAVALHRERERPGAAGSAWTGGAPSGGRSGPGSGSGNDPTGADPWAPRISPWKRAEGWRR